MRKPVRIGVGGPVGSGKTALIEKLCKRLRDEYEIAVITNDIFTKEDALILTRAEALPEERIIGVETGGCPHTAVREDISMICRSERPCARICSAASRSCRGSGRGGVYRKRSFK